MKAPLVHWGHSGSLEVLRSLLPGYNYISSIGLSVGESHLVTINFGGGLLLRGVVNRGFSVATLLAEHAPAC